MTEAARVLVREARREAARLRAENARLHAEVERLREQLAGPSTRQLDPDEREVLALALHRAISTVVARGRLVR